jgi:hypothetical protein
MVHFDLAESQRQAIPVIHFKVVLSSVPFGVFTETVKLLFAFLFPMGFKICHW